MFSVVVSSAGEISSVYYESEKNVRRIFEFGTNGRLTVYGSKLHDKPDGWSGFCDSIGRVRLMQYHFLDNTGRSDLGQYLNYDENQNIIDTLSEFVRVRDYSDSISINFNKPIPTASCGLALLNERREIVYYSDTIQLPVVLHSEVYNNENIAFGCILDCQWRNNADRICNYHYFDLPMARWKSVKEK